MTTAPASTEDEAVRALAASQGEPLWFFADLAKIRLGGRQSAGALAVVEMVGPPGDAPPLHVHRREDEGFHVLEGELTLHIGGEVVRCPAGSCGWAPRDVPHIYVVTSDRPARWLAMTTPAGFEDFVAEVSRAAPAATLPPPPEEPPDIAAVAAIAAAHGVELLGPPGMSPRELSGR